MTHHWEALGWTLVHFLWQGAAIALVYRIADLALARRSATARYALALVALLVMLGVSIGTLAYEEASLYQPVTPASSLLRHAAAAHTAPFRVELLNATAAAPLRQADHFVLGHLLPYLDGLWLAGVLLLSIRALGGWWLIRRMRARLERAPHTLLLRLDVLRRRMNIGQFVDLRLSSKLTNPLTAGVMKPWILLPITALTSLSAEQLEVVLAHELAHIRRADYLWNLLQTMVETLFFFHPAVWWVSRRVREERELCCDDIAVRCCSDPTVYASALLRLEEERRTRLHLAMALDGHQSRAGLRARILRILGDGEAAPRSFRPISLAGIATLLIVFLCPLPKVFASFRAVPAVAARIAPAARKVVFKAMHPVLQASEPAPAPTAAPTPKPSAAVPMEDAQESPAPAPAAAPQPSTHTDYIDAMKAAGYDVDLDKYIAMKVQGITPEYAAQMSKVFGEKLTAGKLIALKVQGVDPDYIAKMRAAGFDVDAYKFISMRVQDITPDYAAEMSKVFGEKLSADKLIALKVQGVDPDYMAKMRAAGYDADANKFIAMRIQGVTPEFADEMAKVGFGKPTVDQLMSLKVQGVTPEFAAKLHADGIEASSFNDLVTYRIFNVSPEFVAEMKSAGFGDIPAKKLVALRVQGITPEFAKDMKAQFGNVTLDDLIQLRVFGIDPDFIASAKRHGFEPLTVQKLVKLRISGILDDADDKKQQ